MAFKKATIGLVPVTLEYYEYDEEGLAVRDDEGNQVKSKYKAVFKRRSSGASSERKFHEALTKNEITAFQDFCSLIVEIHGFLDFPAHTPETISDVAFGYFNNPDMIELVEQFMGGYYQQTMPAHFFRRPAPGSVENDVPQRESKQAGA